MITEIVFFRLPTNMSRDELVEKYRASVPNWRANSDLVHKSFLHDEHARRGGGVYLWKSLEAAQRVHGEAFRQRIRTVFGSDPEFQYFDSPIVIDNVAAAVIDEAGSTPLPAP
jgi:hypothetical protein